MANKVLSSKSGLSLRFLHFFALSYPRKSLKNPKIQVDLASKLPRVFGAGAEGARGILEAIAGSMITVSGVVFSVVIVALSLASNQYTPRILRNFMRDRGTQVVLGVFVSVFIYCLLNELGERLGGSELVTTFDTTSNLRFLKE